jgi:hypothetical protein
LTSFIAVKPTAATLIADPEWEHGLAVFAANRATKIPWRIGKNSRSLLIRGFLLTFIFPDKKSRKKNHRKLSENEIFFPRSRKAKIITSRLNTAGQASNH